MFYTDFRYRDYFHKILAFEVDNLTDDLKDIVDITDEDCYILCTNFIDANGELTFAVLSVGNSFDNITKGLEIDNELMTYKGIDLAFFECKIINPSIRAIAKGYNIIKKLENTNDVLEEIRNEHALDFVRNPFFPDKLQVKYSEDTDLNINITKIGDWLIEGKLDDGGLVKAIPYSSGNERKLITIVTSNDISDVEEKALEDFLTEVSKGIFNITKTNERKS